MQSRIQDFSVPKIEAGPTRKSKYPPSILPVSRFENRVETKGFFHFSRLENRGESIFYQGPWPSGRARGVGVGASPPLGFAPVYPPGHGG